MMTRLGVLLVAIAVLTAPLAALGQPREKAPRVGVLAPGRAPGGNCVPGFRQGLRDLGYIEGQTIIVDLRFADEDPDRIPILAAELIRQTPDVLWTHSPQGARAAKQATPTVPIVVGVAGFLVEQGLAISLARPGGNVTGFELGDIELAGKRLQLLKEAVPTVARVAVLVDPTMRPYDSVPKNLEPQARSLGVQLQRVEAGALDAFDGAFAAMVRARADALMIADLPLFIRGLPGIGWLESRAGGREGRCCWGRKRLKSRESEHRHQNQDTARSLRSRGGCAPAHPVENPHAPRPKTTVVDESPHSRSHPKPGSAFIRNSQRLFELALRHRLPTISGWRRYAEAGSLIAYGANVHDVCRRSAAYVDRILRGARPGDLPIEQPSMFELVINMKTARALGLRIPPSVLLRADRVIE